MDDNCFRDTKMCNPDLCSSWALSLACSRDEMWSCCATLYVLYLRVHCSYTPSVGWRFFSKQWNPVPTLRKCSPLVRAWIMLRIQIARLPMGLVPHWRRWRSCLQGGPRSWRSCQQFFPATLCSQILYCPQIVVLLAVLCVDCEEWICILLGSLPCAQHSFVCILFSLEQSRSLIEWLLSSSFCIHRENNASNF